MGPPERLLEEGRGRQRLPGRYQPSGSDRGPSRPTPSPSTSATARRTFDSGGPRPCAVAQALPRGAGLRGPACRTPHSRRRELSESEPMSETPDSPSTEMKLDEVFPPGEGSLPEAPVRGQDRVPTWRRSSTVPVNISAVARPGASMSVAQLLQTGPGASVGSSARSQGSAEAIDIYVEQPPGGPRRAKSRGSSTSGWGVTMTEIIKDGDKRGPKAAGV